MTRPAQVTVAVLPSDIAFLLEDGEGDVEEAGRFPRSAIRDVDVVDERGDHVPEPIRETIEVFIDDRDISCPTSCVSVCSSSTGSVKSSTSRGLSAGAELGLGASGDVV